MKTTFLTIGLSLVGIMAFAQKKEIRNAGKAVESGNFAEARTLLNSVESQISAEKDKVKADFYLTKAKAYYGKGASESLENLVIAGEAYKKAEELGEEEAKKGVMDTENALINAAVKDQNSNNYKMASKRLYASYQLNPSDTTNLYYAAGTAISGKDYDTALTYYNKLVDLGYTGKGVEYLAENKASGQKENFPTKKDRDNAVKIGTHINPEDNVLESKVGEITKNIAVIYLQNGEEKKAMDAIQRAKEANPNDTSLMLSEASIYFKQGDKAKYASTVEKILEKDPTNADLYFNLGVLAYEAKDMDKAKEYYKNAIKYNPSMSKAYANLVVAILSKEQSIIDQMNKLGMSAADNKKYDALSKERKNLYKEAVPYMEKAIELDADNTSMKKSLYNIYMQLGEDAKAKALKAQM